MHHLKWLSSAFLLLVLAGGVNGQDSLTLAKRPDPQQVATAKETIRSATQTPTLLAFGGYAIIDIKLEGKLSSYVVPGSDDCIKTISIPKGQGYTGWLVPKGETAHKWTSIDPVPTHDRLLVTGTANGTTTLIWMTVQNNEAVVVAAFQFIVGEPRPPPPPDIDPDVDPILPGKGFRVLIVRETKDLAGLTPQQIAIFSATEVRQYLNQKTVLEGNQRAYRIWDKDTDISRENEDWKTVMNGVLNGDPARKISKATSFPWLVITNGKEGYEGPLPKDVPEMMAKLKQFGGN